MKKKIAWILTGTLVCNLLLSSLFCVPVLALSAGGLQSTIASIIISLLLQTGVAPTNEVWLNQLNTAYGVESSIGTIADCIESGLLTETAEGLIDTGLSDAIASQSAYTNLGISDIFTTTVNDAGVVAGSGAVNLTNTAINTGTLGTIGAFAGAVGVGVGVGVLIDHARQAFQNFIRSGVKINYNREYVNGAPAGYYTVVDAYGSSGTNYRVHYAYVKDSTITGAYLENQFEYREMAADSTGNYNGDLIILNSNNQNVVGGGKTNVITGSANNLFIGGYIKNWGTPYSSSKVFQTRSECENYINGVIANPSLRENPISSDLVGPSGNHTSVDNPNGTVEYPGFVNMIPEGADMNPVDMDDYQQYVDDANQNTEDGETEETQGAMFDEFVNQYIVDPNAEPELPIVPDNPSVPERPIIPDQPETPDKPVVDPTEQADALQGVTDIDLRAVFPFCIPFDLYAALSNLKYEGREAPVIVFTFPDTRFTSSEWGIIIDLSEFEEVAEILRKLELLVFIIGLAVETRKLIGAT